MSPPSYRDDSKMDSSSSVDHSVAPTDKTECRYSAAFTGPAVKHVSVLEQR